MDKEHDIKESDDKYTCEVCEDEGCADCEYIQMKDSPPLQKDEPN